MIGDKSFWAKAVIIDAIAFGLIYLWVGEGVAGARNVIVVSISLLTLWYVLLASYLVAHSSSGLSAKELGITVDAYPKGFKTYTFATDVAFFFAFLWFDKYLIAVIFFLGWAGKMTIRNIGSSENAD